MVVVGGLPRTSDVQRFNVSRSCFKVLTNFPSLPHIASGVSVVVDPKGNIYVMGGTTYLPSGDSEEEVNMFDIQTQTWTPLPSLISGKYQAPAFYMSGYIYYVGSQSMQRLSLEDTHSGWENFGDPPIANMFYAASCVNNQQVWVSHGSSMHRLKSGSTTWDEMASMPTSAQYGHLMACAADYIYVIGDENIKMQVYDISSNIWSQLGGPLPYDRRYTGALYLPWNEIIVPAGRDPSGNKHNTLLRYDISTGTWSKSSSVLKKAVVSCGVALLPSQ